MSDNAMCLFCGGKEPAEISVTGMGFPMGTKCLKKAIRKNVLWDEDTTLKTLKSRLRFGQKEPLNSEAGVG
jgi:hypothetical protein